MTGTYTECKFNKPTISEGASATGVNSGSKNISLTDSAAIAYRELWRLKIKYDLMPIIYKNLL
jgi:hypothetical protein